MPLCTLFRVFFRVFRTGLCIFIDRDPEAGEPSQANRLLAHCAVARLPRPVTPGSRPRDRSLFFLQHGLPLQLGARVQARFSHRSRESSIESLQQSSMSDSGSSKAQAQPCCSCWSCVTPTSCQQRYAGCVISRRRPAQIRLPRSISSHSPKQNLSPLLQWQG